MSESKFESAPFSQVLSLRKNDPISKALIENIMGKLATKKNKVSIKCETCNIDFTSQVVFETHIVGAKHCKKLKGIEILKNLRNEGKVDDEIAEATNLRCSICAINLNSSLQLQMHLEGNKHKTKCKRNNLPESTLNPNNFEAEDDQDEDDDDEEDEKRKRVKEELEEEEEDGPPKAKMTKFHCEPCGLVLNSSHQLEQHLSSKKHKVKSEKKIPFQFINKRRNGANLSGDIDNYSARMGLPLLSESFLPPNTILADLP